VRLSTVLFIFAMSLAIVAGGLVASLLQGQRFRALLLQATVGALAGGLPAALLFQAARDYQAAYALIADLLGLLVGGFLGGVSTATISNWPGRRRRPWGALLLAVGGAAIGTCALFVAVSLSPRTGPLSFAIGICAGGVGALAALGSEVGGGAPAD